MQCLLPWCLWYKTPFRYLFYIRADLANWLLQFPCRFGGFWPPAHTCKGVSLEDGVWCDALWWCWWFRVCNYIAGQTQYKTVRLLKVNSWVMNLSSVKLEKCEVRSVSHAVVSCVRNRLVCERRFGIVETPRVWRRCWDAFALLAHTLTANSKRYNNRITIRLFMSSCSSFPDASLWGASANAMSGTSDASLPSDLKHICGNAANVSWREVFAKVTDRIYMVNVE